MRFFESNGGKVVGISLSRADSYTSLSVVGGSQTCEFSSKTTVHFIV